LETGAPKTEILYLIELSNSGMTSSQEMLWFAQIEPFAHHPGLGALVGYALGCFTTGYYLVRWKTGQDIREIGSGSCGARNVGRVLGRNGFLLTVVGDVLKGVLSVIIAQMVIGGEAAALLAMIGVVVGHIWPIQLKFHGGKGVSTSLGALLVADWALCGAYLVLFGLLYAATRKNVISGLFAFALLPIVAYFFSPTSQHVAAISVLACIILTAHYRNVFQEINQLFLRQPSVDETKADPTK
jgi:glycerol-3-phosphate acyltransferase PlsY